MRRRSLVLGVTVPIASIGLGMVVALAAAADLPKDAGRASSERPCERPYVEHAVREVEKPGYVLDEIDGAGSTNPAALAFAPDGSGDGLLGDRTGRVARIVDGRPTNDVVLDFTGETLETGDGGLLGIAYDPGGGWVYLYRATAEKDDRVDAFPLDATGRPDPAGQREILFVDHPSSEQHHGGAFGFGPDGMLWIGLGDGGGLGDPRENAQNPGRLLGKLLRIDPTPDGPEPYVVPRDNPHVDDPAWRPEVWLLGLRNPFRLSFDAATGDLWLADVGQSCWEELNLLPASAGRMPGANLGWDQREGNTDFEGGDRGPGQAVDPVIAYAHRSGWCAIVAGFVLHDGVLPGLDGYLLHADFCRGKILAYKPTAAGEPPVLVDTGLRTERPVAFVPGPDGVPWVLTLEGPIYRILPG